VALTIKKVAKLVRRGEPGRHLDASGLYLIVSSKGNAHWERRYERHGRSHWMGLGGCTAFTLIEARERNRKVSQQLADGIDPLAHKRAQRAALQVAALKTMSFKEAAEKYIQENAEAWRNAKHGSQWRATLDTYVLPEIGSLSVADIDTPIVLRVLKQTVDGKPFWNARPETASRVRGRIESILAWATVNGFRSGDNPARWRNHLDKALPKKTKISRVEHHAALPYRAIPEFMAALRTREGSAARALEFTILTAARTGEVIGAKWDEFDLADKVWTVPAGRMKADKEHRVALSTRAIELLTSLYHEDGNDFIFIGPQRGSGLSNMAMTAVLRRMQQNDITVHGFRSTFRDWAAEQTNFPSEVVEMALAHTIDSKVEAAYRRGDLLKKRFALAESWAAYCASPPQKKDDIVVPMRGARR
jgi:integrase